MSTREGISARDEVVQDRDEMFWGHFDNQWWGIMQSILWDPEIFSSNKRNYLRNSNGTYRNPFEWCAKCGHEMCFPNSCNPCAKFVTSMCEIYSRSFRNLLWSHQQSISLPVVIYSLTGAKYKNSVFPNIMQTTVLSSVQAISSP